MSEAAITLEAADIATILKALPHRYPFLMVDRIISMRGDEAAIGIDRRDWIADAFRRRHVLEPGISEIAAGGLRPAFEQVTGHGATAEPRPIIVVPAEGVDQRCERQ